MQSARSLLEAAYDLDLDDAVWLRGVADVVHRNMETGLGQMCSLVNLSPSKAVTVETAITTDDDYLAEHAQALAESTPPVILQKLFGAPFCEPLSQLADGLPGNPLETWFRPTADHIGIRDSLGIGGFDQFGQGFIALNVTGERIEITQEAKYTWQRLVVHLLAAIRLRQSLRDGAGGAPEAVIEPSGSMLHAEGNAREQNNRDALTHAVREREKARGIEIRGQRQYGVTDETAERLDLWRGLVDGVWSLVDWVEADGRRIVLARRNMVSRRTQPLLSTREEQVTRLAAGGHPYKLIAYELGLSTSAVSTLLYRALDKLGIRGRANWMQVAPALLEADVSNGTAPLDGRAAIDETLESNTLNAQFRTGLQHYSVRSRETSCHELL